MILSINGMNVDSNYAYSNEESQIVVDFGEYQGGELPYGVAGANTNYPVFNAVAYNKVGGMLNTPNVDVYYGGKDGALRTPLIITDGRFKTENVGKYHIVYTSQTMYGKVEKTVTIDVLSEYKSEDALVLTHNEKMVSDANIGDVIYFCATRQKRWVMPSM